jgi:HEAT repeat protein
MTSSHLRYLRAAAAAAAVALAAAAAPAESRSEEDATPLALLRRAGTVAVARGEAPGAGTAAGALGVLRLEEVLRGAGAAGEGVVLRGLPERTDVRVLPGTRYLAFLVRGEGGAAEVLGGATGLFALLEDPSGRDPLAALVGSLSAEVGKDGRLLRPDRVRSALAGAAAGGDPRVRSGAALDLLREPGLLEGIPDAERDALARAFAGLDPKDRAKPHLALLLGRLRPPGAAALLADALFAEGGAVLRPAVGRALGDLGDPAGPALLAARAASPRPAERALVAGTLGGTGLPGARAPLEALLGDGTAEVRREAAVSLGRLRFPESGPALLARLRGAVGGAAPEGDARVRRALAWAVARGGDAGAVEGLRALSLGDPDPGFRAYAAEALARPRPSFEE